MKKSFQDARFYDNSEIQVNGSKENWSRQWIYQGCQELGVLALKAAHELTELRFVIKQVDKVPLMYRRSKPWLVP